MSQRVIRQFLLLCLCWAQLVQADIVLPGSFNIGDNSSSALRPTTMVSNFLGVYAPVNPIHFSISHNITLSEIRLENASGLDAGAHFVIWDRFGNVVLDRQASDVSRDRVSRNGGWQLAPGEYRMAVWGGCLLNDIYVGAYDPSCRDWDDFSFNDIRLVANGTTTAVHFIERTHIGDNTDVSRWYPPAAKGSYVRYDFTLNKRSRLDTLTLYNLRDWSVRGGSRMFIRTAGSAYTPLVYYFDHNGDVNWNVNYELSAGTYELWVESVSASDRDDISWDDLILRYTQLNDAISLDGLCSQAFPYPAQGRTSNSSIDLGNKNSTAGRVWGTQGGRLGYANTGQIKNSNDQNCDGGMCVPAGNSNALTLPAFPTINTGPDLIVGNAEYRRLDGSSGLKFGTITVNNQGRLEITSPGLYIKEMNLLSGRQGKDYTVKLAAGEYWIENLVMTPDTRVELAGPVKLYVRNIKLESASLLNSPSIKSVGEINRLLLVVYNTLDMRDEATLSGLVYQADTKPQDELYLQPGAYIFGRVSSVSLRLGDKAVIDSRGYECDISPSGIDHYELVYPSTSLTCEAAPVQLRACRDSACSRLADNSTSVTLSPAAGWSQNPVVLGNSGQVNLTLSSLAAKGVVLGLSTSSPQAPLRCFKDGVVDASCTLSFVDAALRFNVPTFYAGERGTSSIQAIKSNEAGATKVCVPLLTGNQTLQFGYSKLVSESTSVAVPSVNGSPIAPQGNATVTFDGNGVGQLAVQYPDAGVLRLDATFQKSDATGTLRLSGSDTFAVLPSAIVLRGQDQPACSGVDDASYMANCSVYRKAGEEFTLQAQALNRQGALTPGFGAADLALQWAKLAPAVGVSGAAAPASLPLKSGLGSVPATWDEVGVLRVSVPDFVPYPTYQDETPQLTVPLRWSEPIGRFVPWDFNLQSGVITPACGQFSYMSQPFGVKMRVQARNKGAGVTKNYEGKFAKGLLYLVAGNDHDGVDRTDRVGSVMANWAAGETNLDSQSRFARLSERNPSLTTPEEPFKVLRFGLQVVDGESPSVSSLADTDMNPGVKNGCNKGVNCNARQLKIPARQDDTMPAYYGRLLAGTGAGLASAPLAIALQMQYYEAGAWFPNKEDQCTQLSLANQGFTFLNPAQTFDAASRDLSLGGNRKIRLGLGNAAPGGESAQAKDGEILFQFAKPDISVRIPYKVDLSKQPLRPLWLSDPVTLQGEAIFGSSRGNDRIIYRREVMP